MTKNFQEYKQKKKQADAYEQASKVQEAFALSVYRAGGDEAKQYEGHISVIDVLNKIDAMIRMFENSIRDNNYQESSSKIIEVICSLYDLAQIKMAEAKKQAKSYMEKASGSSVPEPSIGSAPGSSMDDEEDNLDDVPEFPDDSEDIEDPPINNGEKDITFKTRGPMAPTGGEKQVISDVPPGPERSDF